MVEKKKRYQVGNDNKLDTDAILNKRWMIPKKVLVEDEKVSREMDVKNKRLQLGKLQSIVQKTMENINDGIGIKELLPDLNLICEILVATILAPKDLTEVKLSIVSTDARVPAQVTEAIRKHLTTEYDLESEMSTILKEALFDIGSHIRVPMPASTLSSLMISHTQGLEHDVLITAEHLKNPKLPGLGIAVDNDNIIAGMESLNINYQIKPKGKTEYQNETATVNLGSTGLHITDNPIYLLNPTLVGVTQRVNIRKQLEGIGLEGLEYRTPNEKNVYMRKMFDFVENVMFKRQSLEEVGKNLNPIVLTVPAESVIPITIPSDPTKHVGYYFILDENCNFITGARNRNLFKDLNKKIDNTIHSGSSMIVTNSMANQQQNPNDPNTMTFMKQPIYDAYVYQVEQELRDALAKGAYGENLIVQRPEELLRLMFSRQLLKMQTRALYIPAEMVTYFAFDYDELGRGVSLIEKTKLYSSLRAIMMFAEVMAGIKNSVPGRTLNIVLDEADPDQQGTVESIITEMSNMQAVGFPLWKLNPSDIVEGINKANINVKVDGGDVFPNTSIDIEERRREMNKPDEQLGEMLKKQQYSGMGVSPELADRGLEGEFATGITQANLLQAKRIMVYQDTFNYQLTDHMHKYIYAGGPLCSELQELHSKIQGDDILSFEEMINSLKCELPKPDTAVIKAQKEAFEEYAAFIEMGVDTHINEDMLRDLLKGEYSASAAASIKAAIVNLLKRQYLRRQNMLPEIDELMTATDTSVGEAIAKHSESILTVIKDVLPRLYSSEYTIVDKKTAEAIRAVEERKAADNPDGMPNAGGSSDYNSGDETDTDDQDTSLDDEFNMDDLGMGDEGADLDNVDETESKPEETSEETEETTTDETEKETPPKEEEPAPKE